MEESNNSFVVNFPQNLMDQLLWEEEEPTQRKEALSSSSSRLEYASQPQTIIAQAFDLRTSETSIVPASLKVRDCLDIQTQRLALASHLNICFMSSPHLMIDDQPAEEVRDTATPLTDHSSGSADEDAKKDHKGKQVQVSFQSSSLENRKRKAEKDITLETLRPHFAGSLKDAAKNIGVCPTTLKRICRQNGISRWPSRKIKKVEHSLQKLQMVMDSVDGVQGSLHLASFYSSFPQLQSSSSSSSFPLINPTQAVHVPSKSPPSSSASHNSSGSSTSSSSREQELGAPLKQTLSHQHLLTLSSSSLQEEQRPPVRATSSLPPLPSTVPRKTKDGIKVNAMFRDSKLTMRLQQHSRLTDLRREIANRFGMDEVLRNNFNLKYLDDDQEWVLLTCDDDLEECIQVYKSSLKKTIRILVHHPLSLPSLLSLTKS